MYVIRASDRETFLANRPEGLPINVVRMPTTQLRRRRNLGVTSFPAVELTYSFIVGDQQWVFQELRVADDPRGGFVSLDGTLWSDLANGLAPYLLIPRSGSF